MVQDLSEEETRLYKIDKDLKNSGWLKKYIKIEINSVKSNFRTKEYISRSVKTVEKGVDKFIDYLLLAEDNVPLALIEAKKFSADPDKGRLQARSYQKDIEKQTNIILPIFLTNGREWFFIDQDGIERAIANPFSQDVLKRRLELYKNRKDLKLAKVNPKITDRVRSITIVKEVAEYFSEGQRKSLIEMATGTGKTRVSMAILEVLLNANYVRNVLFIADRITLARQAKEEGFVKFFNEPVTNIQENGFSTSSRFYVSTIQTLMAKKKEKKVFEQFNSGFFDLIIFDEAHRSIYDKNNLINKYFDAIKIGLTATPRSIESRNTYDLFGCEKGKPTVQYSYDEAVKDGVLVKYRATVIETEVLELGIEGKHLDARLKDELRRQEEDPEKVEFTGKQFARIFMDDKTNEVVVREFMSRCYKSDDNKPCKSIFFCANQKHAKHIKKVFGKLFPLLSNDVQVITSDMYRADDEVKRFKLESEPRIALSVGMLDTGVDVPEVMNLVFVRPVFSSSRFWQMIGRGTRNNEACKHKQWLPAGEKNDFRILDFKIGGHSNIHYHEFKEAKENNPTKDVMTRIFLARVELLHQNLTIEEKELISEKIIGDISSLGEESFILQEKLSLIKKIKKSKFDLEKYLEELKTEISPCMILKQTGNPYVASFILEVEKLFQFVLNENRDKIEKIRASVKDKVENLLLKDNLTEIKEKRDLLIGVLQLRFWEELTFKSVEWLIIEIAPLMKYFEPAKPYIVQIDKPDFVREVLDFEKEIKEDTKMQEFLKKNPIALQLREGKGITSSEIKALEAEMKTLSYGFTIEQVQKVQGKDFIAFLYDIIGKSYDKDPRLEMEHAFDEFILKNSHYTGKQLEFLRLLKEVFLERKSIELKDFAKEPFSSENPTSLFEFGDLVTLVDKVNELRWK